MSNRVTWGMGIFPLSRSDGHGPHLGHTRIKGYGEEEEEEGGVWSGVKRNFATWGWSGTAILQELAGEGGSTCFPGFVP